ncbi:MAG: acetyl-CoA carboxylase carboxyltransferase subunit beta [Candidatus Competibacteraceae bacterium]|nr:acetyl-CoA carboxylase carboxyltransferase subunit beta [Candidatus Competibacteraceae bacterium]
MMWFKRNKDGILTSTAEKKETPEGLWYKCPACKEIMPAEDHLENLWVCKSCQYHERIGSEEYFHVLFDNNKYKKLDEKIKPVDFLNFKDTKPYANRLKDATENTNLLDALQTAVGKINGMEMVVACMDFSFIGGSMGTVVGEKISRAIDYCIKYKKPFIIISKSGGARMMESAFSLMQMAKTSAKLTLLSEAELPYISVCTDPTTGGVTASFAMLGDLNIAEPNALIGFAGPRVVKETIKTDLPDGFQRSEFLLEKGFLDFIVERKQLKDKIAAVVDMMYYSRKKK